LLLHEKSLLDEVKFQVVDLAKGEHKQASHLQRQPFGKVPALVQGDFNLYESRAICRYIEEKYTDYSNVSNNTPSAINNNNKKGGRIPRLLCTDVKQRALFEQWASLESTLITPEITTILMHRIWGPMRNIATDEAAVKKAIDNVTPALDILEKQLQGKQYILGDITLIDIFFVPHFNLLGATPEKLLIESRPNVNAWWNRLKGRTAWQQVLHSLRNEKNQQNRNQPEAKQSAPQTQ
jgi:glutathione S-transferase